MSPNYPDLFKGLCSLAICVSTAACGPSVSPVAPASVQTPATVPMSVGPYGAPAIGDPFTVSGIVVGLTATGAAAPVQRAYVEACGYDSVETDENGFFTLTLPANTLSLFIQKAGYRPVSVSLNPAVTTRLDVRMERE